MFHSLFWQWLLHLQSLAATSAPINKLKLLPQLRLMQQLPLLLTRQLLQLRLTQQQLPLMQRLRLRKQLRLSDFEIVTSESRYSYLAKRHPSGCLFHLFSIGCRYRV